MIALLTVTDPLLAMCISYSLQMVILQYLSQNNHTHSYLGILVEKTKQKYKYLWLYSNSHFAININVQKK